MNKLSVPKLVVLALIVLAGCKKNDAPDTTPSKPVYLPVAIYYTGNDGSNSVRDAADSIVYNADNTPATLYMQTQNQEWRQRIQFVYNDRQQCVSIRWFRGDELTELDSLVYASNKTSVYKQDPIDHHLRDSTFITFNNDNQALLFGSKDTAFQMDVKLLRYTELTYSNGNPVKILDHRYESYFEDATSTTDELTCTYDTHPNPLYEVFSRNPYIINIIHQDETAFSLGKNSLTSLTTKGNDGSTSTLNYDNKYDADGNLSSSKVKAASGDEFGIEYSYIKR